MPIVPVQPEGWPSPSGYAHGVLGRGAVLHVAGQVGWDDAGRFAAGLAAQIDVALGRFVEVVRAAGGRPADVAEMSWYLTDLAAYRGARSELGAVWRRHLGRHYPAMAVVGVPELVEPEALVEIRGHAVIDPSRIPPAYARALGPEEGPAR